MKINRDIYPHNIEVKKLPFYLAGIGGGETQIPIIRVEGYHWHQILFSESGKGTLKFDNATVSIDENFRNDFPLTYLAKEAGITPQHLCRVFKESMNMQPTDYVVKRRLREAKRLIQQNELPISEVAIRSGFSDAAYFSTVFKKHEGLTPLEYRKRMR